MVDINIFQYLYYIIIMYYLFMFYLEEEWHILNGVVL